MIGAGVAGLVCAHRLGEEGHATDVYERWPGLGGQAATIDIGGGHLLERYYHHLFTSDRHIAELYTELGMPDELEWRPSSMAFFLEGRSWPFTSPLHLLRFGPLSPTARLRMGLAVLKLQKTARGRAVRGHHGARLDPHAMGAQTTRNTGVRCSRQGRDRADESAMAWRVASLPSPQPRQEARQERSLPASSWEPLFDALRESIEEHSVARAERPPRGPPRPASGGFEMTAAAGSSGGARPAAVETTAARRYTRSSPPAHTSSCACSTTTCRRSGRYSAYRAQRVPHRAVLLLSSPPLNPF